MSLGVERCVDGSICSRSFADVFVPFTGFDLSSISFVRVRFYVFFLYISRSDFGALGTRTFVDVL